MTTWKGQSSAADLVRRLLQPGAAPFVPESVEQLLELAWALKDLCYAAWSSEPQRAAQAAEVLQSLSDSTLNVATDEPDTHCAASVREVQAVADWTMGIAHLTRGEMPSAIECFDTAAAAFEGLRQRDHAAQTQVPKIMALSMLGRYSDATACADHARRVFIELGDARSAGKVSLNLGALHERLGAYAEAVRESSAAAVHFAQVGDRELSIMADINTGNGLTALGDFDEALRIYARAEMRAATHSFPVLEALAKESIGLVHLARGQYREALAGLEESRQRYESLDLPQHLATAEKQLGDAYLELRLLPEAAALFEKAIARFQDLDFPDEQAWTYVQLGRVQALSGREEPAENAFARAAELFCRQGIGVGEATVHLAQSELALATGNHSDALRLAELAASGFNTSDLAEGRLRADTVCAYAQLSAGDAKLAAAQFATTLAQARELQLIALQVRCLTGQGLAAQAQGDLTTTKSALEAATVLFEEQRRALPGDDFRSAFLGDHLRPYEALLELALQAHEKAPGNDSATAVLLQLDRVRARSLGERLGHGPSHCGSDAISALRERLNWLYHQAQRKQEQEESTLALVEEMRSTEQELLEHARRGRISAPAGAPTPAAPDASPELVTGAAGDDIDALRAIMKPTDALVEYGILGDELFACIATPAGVSVHRHIASWGETLDALQAARMQIETLAGGAQAYRQHMDTLTRRALAHLQRLYKRLWLPITDSLAQSQRVLVVPCGPLGWLPFAALHDGEAALAEKIEIAMAPSARIAMHGYQRQPLASTSMLSVGESSRLPHAAQEAEYVASLFTGSKVFTGEQATLAAIQDHGGQADVLHLACHAKFRGDNPLFSALDLADGQLTVELAETLNLRPGLVVLSACETGLSEVGTGDEMVGLVRAFLIAGAARVVATRWPVEDEHAARFCARFYQARGEDLSPSDALRRAQLETMREEPHPFYWAAFTLYGGF